MTSVSSGFLPRRIAGTSKARNSAAPTKNANSQENTADEDDEYRGNNTAEHDQGYLHKAIAQYHLHPAIIHRRSPSKMVPIGKQGSK